MYFQDIAIVLSRKDFREDDLLISFYTQKHGKVVMVAKGAKKIKSKLAGHVEPMNLVDIEWVAGKGGEKLIGAQAMDVYQNIKDNYDKIQLGFYFLDILDRAIKPHHPDKRIFDFLKSVLNKLVSVETQDLASKLPIVKLCFDYKILFLLGYNPVHRTDEVGQVDLVNKIINSSVDSVVAENVDEKTINKLQNKVNGFLEEVIEGKVAPLT